VLTPRGLEYPDAPSHHDWEWSATFKDNESTLYGLDQRGGSRPADQRAGALTHVGLPSRTACQTPKIKKDRERTKRCASG
jgi:hypothetical protein